MKQEDKKSEETVETSETLKEDKEKDGSSKPAWIMGAIAIAISLIFCFVAYEFLKNSNASYIRKTQDGIAQIETATQKSLADIDKKTKAGIEAIQKVKPAIEVPDGLKVEEKAVETETDSVTQKPVDNKKSTEKPKSAMDKLREARGK